MDKDEQVNIITVDTDKFTISNIASHYESIEGTVYDRDKAFIMFFEKEQYKGIISYTMFRTLSGKYDLEYAQEHLVKEYYADSIEKAEKILEENPLLTVVPLERPLRGIKQCRIYDKNAEVDNEIREKQYANISKILRRIGVKIYTVGLPRNTDIKNWHDAQYTPGYPVFWSDEMEKLRKAWLPCFTEVGEAVLKKQMDSKKAIHAIGDAERKIYIVGPCIVEGFNVGDEDTLLCTLYRVLADRGYIYKIVPIIHFQTLKEDAYELLNRDFYEGDIVLIIQDYFKTPDIKLHYIFDAVQDENVMLYMDTPMHTTKYGNEKVAAAIINELEHRGALSSEERERRCLGRKELLCLGLYQEKLNSYFRSVDDQWKTLGFTGGAIEMTANPFTYGHRYLIETASRQVDYLIVLVVREDDFLFSYEERKALIQEGCRDIANVMVVDGNEFLISKRTFKAYFEKEIRQDAGIDAEQEIYHFGTMIAPHFGIRKRFVGTEPTDMVTNQYNELMKQRLPQYGIEVVEIPRKEIMGEVVSASRVRNLVRDNALGALKEIVPDSTYEFVVRNREALCERMKHLNWGRDTAAQIRQKRESIDFIRAHEELVIYGIGSNTKELLCCLKEEEKKRLIFCDKAAESRDIIYEGKRVIAPDELFQKYRRYYILVASSTYSREIYSMLRRNGIAKSRIYCNVIGL